LAALGGGAGRGAGGAGPGAAAAMENLRNNPQMAQLRQLMAQNPALIQPLIQQIVASNPGMAAALNQNPDLLFQLLGEGMEGEEFEGGEGEGGHGGPVTIALSPEDAEAIQRVSVVADLIRIWNFADCGTSVGVAWFHEGAGCCCLHSMR
jgi:UV excision repair protein RAD23